MKKIILLIITLFMISGCSLKYNVLIDEEKSVTDYLSITIPSSLGATYFDTTREYLDYMYENKTEEYGISGYSKEYEIGNDFSTINMTKTYSSVESYLNSGIIKKLYSNISVLKDGDNTIVKLSGMNDIFGVVNSYDVSHEVEPFSIVLSSKYVIEDDNSDQKNKFKGEYIWNFEADTFGKEIEFTITDKINTSAILNEKIGMFILPMVILAILIIGYIIYAVFKKKAEELNSI